MKKHFILFLYFSFILSSFASHSTSLKPFDKKLIQNVFSVQSTSDITSRYFLALKEFSIHYYGINPLIKEQVAKQYFLLERVEKSAKVFNLVRNIDFYVDAVALDKRVDIYKVHLASFLSDMLVANLYHFNITEIEFEREDVEIDRDLLRVLRLEIKPEGKTELERLYDSLSLDRLDLDSRLEACENSYGCGVALYDDLARAALFINDEIAFYEIFNSFGDFNGENLEMDGPLGGEGHYSDYFESSSNVSNRETRDYLIEVSRAGYHAPLARLRGRVDSSFERGSHQSDALMGNYEGSRMSEFVGDMSTAYGGGDFGPSIGPMGQFDRGVVTKRMIKAGIDLVGRINTGAVGAIFVGRGLGGSGSAIIAGFTIGFFSKELLELKDEGVDLVLDGIETTTRNHVSQSTNNNTDPVPATKEPKDEPKPEPDVEEVDFTEDEDVEDEDDENETIKRGSLTKVDPRALEEAGMDKYNIDRLSKDKMSLKMSMQVNPGRPSIYARCSDAEGDFLEAQTGSRNANYLAGLQLNNRRTYETRDMPVIIFEEDRM
jgi:hypothetical protein